MKFKMVSLNVNLPENSDAAAAEKVEHALTALVKALGYTGSISFDSYSDDFADSKLKETTR